jgi:hypothetical protein
LDGLLYLATFVVPAAILIALMGWHIRRNPPRSLASRDPLPSAGRLWKWAWYSIWGLGMLAISTYAYIWYDYQQNKPRSAEPSIGRVYPEYMRGVTVYLTHSEKARLDFSSAVSFACVVASFIVFGVMQWQQRRVEDQRYSRPKQM